LIPGSSEVIGKLTGVQLVHFPVPGIVLLACVVVLHLEEFGLLVCCTASLIIPLANQVDAGFQVEFSLLISCLLDIQLLL